MTKNELIQLLKELRENKSKYKLRLRDIEKYKRKIERLEKEEIDVSLGGNKDVNRSIKSKGRTSDNVANAVIQFSSDYEKKKKEYEDEIKKLQKEADELKEKIEEAEIRTESLYYKEREILTAYYVENRTAEDIATNLYLDMFGRTCSERYIRELVDRATNRILNL